MSTPYEMQPSSRPDLLEGLAAPEAGRVVSFLEGLLPYLNPDEFMLAGDLAINYRAVANKKPQLHRPQNRQQIIIARRNSIDPAVFRSLMIAHYHTGQNEHDMSLVVVDPVTHMQAEIVTEDGLFGRESVPAGGTSLPVRSAESQLAVALRGLQVIRSGVAVSRGSAGRPE